MIKQTALPVAAVGAVLCNSAFELSKRRLMSYAAALGGTEDVYLNDLRPGGIVALPTFIVSPEWQIMNGLAYRELLRADNAKMWRCIHVQQDTRVLLPLRPGQIVQTQGTVCAMRQTRIGAYIAVRLDTTLRETGALVAQSWFCGIFLDDRIDGPDASIAEPPALPSDKNMDEWTAVKEPVMAVTRELPHLYTEAANIWNPIHTERSAARDAGLADTLLHGTCTWGAAGLAIIRLFGEGDPTRLRRIGARMTGKALVGARLYLQHKAISGCESELDSIGFRVVDGQGAVILSNGIAEIS